MDILTVPDPRLRRKSKLIKDKLQIRLIGQILLQGMEDYPNAAGLSAPQFGRFSRMIVIQREGARLVLVNPKLSKLKRWRRNIELCESFPGRAFMLERARLVKCKATGVDGRSIQLVAREMDAIILQHEVDHLDGILIDAKGKEYVEEKR